MLKSRVLLKNIITETLSENINLSQILNTKKKFIIVRHGESIWNKSSMFTGWADIPLTDNGKQEAFNMGRTVKSKIGLLPNVIFSSVLKRSLDTANIIKQELDMISDEPINILTSWRLNERHYGRLEGTPRQNLRDQFGDKFVKMVRSDYYIKPPIIKDIKSPIYPVYRNCYIQNLLNGESKEDVLKRLLPYYENDILHTFQEKKFPLIVAHKHTIRVLMKYLLDMDDEEFLNYSLPSKTMILVCLDNHYKYTNHFEIKY